MADEFVQRFLGSPDTKKARAWLEAATPEDFRSLGEHKSTEESLDLLNE